MRSRTRNMYKQSVAEYIKGVAVKHLSAVDAEPKKSNQHEVRSQKLVPILGNPGSVQEKFFSRFMYVSEDGNILEQEEGETTWYDTRYRQKRSQECALYYPRNSVTEMMGQNDFLLIARKKDDTLLFIVTPHKSSTEFRLRWLFNIDDQKSEISRIESHRASEFSEIGFAERMILEDIGIEVEDSDSNLLEELLSTFGATFPKTSQFSEYARIMFSDCSVLDDPDHALMTWMEGEEKLFRTLEKHIIEETIREGFTDSDKFISFALGILNRRKSRAGLAFENHLEVIFQNHKIQYDRGVKTEAKSKPDFLFPGIETYRKAREDKELIKFLTVLGAKTSCKDRWRQFTREAELIKNKHLITVEPAISTHQTDEMQRFDVQLIVPDKIKMTYTQSQQNWLMDVNDFLGTLKDKQNMS